MGPKPNKKWGSAPEDAPPSELAPFWFPHKGKAWKKNKEYRITNDE
jgi:hypothetical protein